MRAKQANIAPALRFDRLTPLYDPIVRFTTREGLFNSILVDAAAIKRGDTVLDVGCGTGTLLQIIADKESAIQLTGLDADAAILAIADRPIVSVALRAPHAISFCDNRPTWGSTTRRLIGLSQHYSFTI